MRRPGRRILFDSLQLNSGNKEATMAQATVQNQKKILAGQKGIVSNQVKILKNQQSILKNQKKILSNQSRILRK